MLRNHMGMTIMVQEDFPLEAEALVVREVLEAEALVVLVMAVMVTSLEAVAEDSPEDQVEVPMAAAHLRGRAELWAGISLRLPLRGRLLQVV